MAVIVLYICNTMYYISNRNRYIKIIIILYRYVLVYKHRYTLCTITVLCIYFILVYVDIFSTPYYP